MEEEKGEGRRKRIHTNGPMVLGCQVLLLLPRPGGLQQRNVARRPGLVPEPFPLGSGVQLWCLSRRVVRKVESSVDV